MCSNNCLSDTIAYIFPSWPCVNTLLAWNRGDKNVCSRLHWSAAALKIFGDSGPGAFCFHLLSRTLSARAPQSCWDAHRVSAGDEAQHGHWSWYTRQLLWKDQIQVLTSTNEAWPLVTTRNSPWCPWWPAAQAWTLTRCSVHHFGPFVLSTCQQWECIAPL